jgi:alpha-ketoglutarate-dependent 2,4-dichlorophenoxyacetate dioxygenase
MSMIEVRALHSHIGAEVRGVDLSRPVSPEVFLQIEAAFNRHSVLVFPGQQIDDQQQIAFSELFGPLEPLANFTGVKKRRLQGAISDLSNLDEDGNVWAENSERRMFNKGNLVWHTDSSFKKVPALCSMLSARKIPPVDGETEFADLRAAYDALPQDQQSRLRGLVVEHSIFRSRSVIGYSTFHPDLPSQLPPVHQLLVRRHPGSGRNSLYLASHASHVLGWPKDEGRKLVEELIEFATQPQFVYQHRWTVGDLVLWDNRCTMHRGRPYDDLKYVRDMHRTTVSEPANTLDQELTVFRADDAQREAGHAGL